MVCLTLKLISVVANEKGLIDLREKFAGEFSLELKEKWFAAMQLSVATP